MKPRTVLVLALGLAGACVSRTTGNEGNLTFWYVNLDLGQISDFNKPVAVGARLDLFVGEAPKGSGATVLSATSDDPAALAVVGTGSNSIVLEGKADGNVLLSVRARVSGGREVEDSVNLTVREAEVMKLGHFCTTEAHAAFIAGSPVRIDFDLQRENGQNLIGYGHYPVTIEPAGALTIDEGSKALETLPLTAGAATGPVTISSQIDDTTLTLDLVLDADVDGAVLRQPLPTIEEDHDALVQVLGTAGGVPVCWNDPELEVAVDSPEVCDVKLFETSGGDLSWLTVEGKVAGDCLFTVTFEEGAGGAGFSETFTVPIAPHRQN